MKGVRGAVSYSPMLRPRAGTYRHVVLTHDARDLVARVCGEIGDAPQEEVPPSSTSVPCFFQCSRNQHGAWPFPQRFDNFRSLHDIFAALAIPPPSSWRRFEMMSLCTAKRSGAGTLTAMPGP